MPGVLGRTPLGLWHRRLPTPWRTLLASVSGTCRLRLRKCTAPWRTDSCLVSDRMQRRWLIGLLLTIAGVIAGVTWWLTHRHETARELALHGNVDLRQIALPFNNSERIADVLVQEGE